MNKYVINYNLKKKKVYIYIIIILNERLDI